jgi:ABC-2 type transport system permease protein
VAALTGGRLRLATERITDAGRGGSGAGGAIVAAGVAVLLYAMIILYGQNVMRSVLEEKTTRVAEVVISSVRPDVLMAGKVLGVGAVGLVQQVVWFGGAAFIGANVAPVLARRTHTGLAAQAADAADVTAAIGIPSVSLGTVAAAFGFFFLGYLLYAALFAAAGAMVNSEQEAQQASFPVMLPLIASAVFIQPVLTNPESGIARAAAWFPFSAPVIMPMRMSLVSTSALEVVAVLAGVAVAAAATTWVAARVYRVGMRMYGKRPSLGELARWVRQAA